MTNKAPGDDRSGIFASLSIRCMSFLIAMLRFFWIGLCALAMLSATRLLLDLPLRPDRLDGFVFGATLFVYHWTQARKWQRYLAWAMGFLSFVCFLYLDGPVKIVALVPALIMAAYYGWRRPGNKGLRMRANLKPHAVAFTWAWVTVFLALSPDLWLKAIFLFAGRAGFIFALALAYDLHDRNYDLQHGMATLANQRSVRTVMRLMYGALFVTVCFAALNYSLDIISLKSICALIFALALSAGLLNLFFRLSGIESWRKLLIDGLMILHWLVLVLFTCFLPDF